MTASAIKRLYERRSRAMLARPSFARGAGRARVRLQPEGFACDVACDDRPVRVDLPEAEGGTATGPHPGQLMRASLAACLAMGYRLWAGRLGIALHDVEVAVECAYDVRGQMGLDPSVPVGWQSICYAVTITSDAAEADLCRVVDTADHLSPMLANLNPAVRRERRLRVVRPAAERREV
jgi:uncharacterized OsmC-like protein